MVTPLARHAWLVGDASKDAGENKSRQRHCCRCFSVVCRQVLTLPRAAIRHHGRRSAYYASAAAKKLSSLCRCQRCAPLDELLMAGLSFAHSIVEESQSRTSAE